MTNEQSVEVRFSYAYDSNSTRKHSNRYKNDSWAPSFVMNDFEADQLHFDDNSTLLITRSGDDINFYERKESKFSLLNTVWLGPRSFLELGHFYATPNRVGLLTNHPDDGPKFYAVMGNEIITIGQLRTDIGIFGDCSHATLALSDLNQSGQQSIIIHGSNGLNIYKLNQKNRIERLMAIPNSAKLDASEEKLFFPNLTRQSYRDIVLLNTTGLFVYQHADKNYRLIDYQPSFSFQKGWEQTHTDSVHFVDVDSDGRDDMLFTGPQGIRLLSFNQYTNEWRSLLDNTRLTTADLHSNVMKVLPISHPFTLHPMIFTQHKDLLRWANLVRIENESTEGKLEPTVNSVPAEVAVIPP